MIHLAARHPDWVLGFADETWLRRVAQPALHSWTAGEPIRLVEQVPLKGGPDSKALCCYGLLRIDRDEVLLPVVCRWPAREPRHHSLSGVGV